MSIDNYQNPCTEADLNSSGVSGIYELIQSKTEPELFGLQNFVVRMLKRVLPQGQMIPVNRTEFLWYKQSVRQELTKGIASSMIFVNNNPILYGYGSLGFRSSSQSNVSISGIAPQYIDSKIYDIPPIAEMYFFNLGWLIPRSSEILDPNDPRWKATDEELIGALSNIVSAKTTIDYLYPKSFGVKVLTRKNLDAPDFYDSEWSFILNPNILSKELNLLSKSEVYDAILQSIGAHNSYEGAHAILKTLITSETDQKLANKENILVPTNSIVLDKTSPVQTKANLKVDIDDKNLINVNQDGVSTKIGCKVSQHILPDTQVQVDQIQIDFYKNDNTNDVFTSAVFNIPYSVGALQVIGYTVMLGTSTDYNTIIYEDDGTTIHGYYKFNYQDIPIWTTGFYPAPIYKVSEFIEIPTTATDNFFYLLYIWNSSTETVLNFTNIDFASLFNNFAVEMNNAIFQNGDVSSNLITNSSGNRKVALRTKIMDVWQPSETVPYFADFATFQNTDIWDGVMNGTDYYLVQDTPPNIFGLIPNSVDDQGNIIDLLYCQKRLKAGVDWSRQIHLADNQIWWFYHLEDMETVQTNILINYSSRSVSMTDLMALRRDLNNLIDIAGTKLNLRFVQDANTPSATTLFVDGSTPPVVSVDRYLRCSSTLSHQDGTDLGLQEYVPLIKFFDNETDALDYSLQHNGVLCCCQAINTGPSSSDWTDKVLQHGVGNINQTNTNTNQSYFIIMDGDFSKDSDKPLTLGNSHYTTDIGYYMDRMSLVSGTYDTTKNQTTFNSSCLSTDKTANWILFESSIIETDVVPFEAKTLILSSGFGQNQTSWTETDQTKMSYLVNKPLYPEWMNAWSSEIDWNNNDYTKGPVITNKPGNQSSSWKDDIVYAGLMYSSGLPSFNRIMVIMKGDHSSTGTTPLYIQYCTGIKAPTSDFPFGYLTSSAVQFGTYNADYNSTTWNFAGLSCTGASLTERTGSRAAVILETTATGNQDLSTTNYYFIPMNKYDFLPNWYDATTSSSATVYSAITNIPVGLYYMKMGITPRKVVDNVLYTFTAFRGMFSTSTGTSYWYQYSNYVNRDTGRRFFFSWSSWKDSGKGYKHTFFGFLDDINSHSSGWEAVFNGSFCWRTSDYETYIAGTVKLYNTTSNSWWAYGGSSEKNFDLVDPILVTIWEI